MAKYKSVVFEVTEGPKSYNTNTIRAFFFFFWLTGQWEVSAEPLKFWDIIASVVASCKMTEDRVISSCQWDFMSWQTMKWAQMSINLSHEIRIISKVNVYNFPKGRKINYFSQTVSTVTKLQNFKYIFRENWGDLLIRCKGSVMEDYIKETFTRESDPMLLPQE